jgi:hypothetical protein
MYRRPGSTLFEQGGRVPLLPRDGDDDVRVPNCILHFIPMQKHNRKIAT